MGELFYENVGLFREEKKLKYALLTIQDWIEKLPLMGVSDKNKTYNTNLKEFIEFKNMLNIGKVIIESALKREESRGAHYRIDFKDESKDFQKQIVALKKDEDVVVELI